MSMAIGSHRESGGTPHAEIVRRGASLISFACAVVLLFAYFAQRTEWTAMGGRRGARLLVFPDPSA